MKTAYNLRLGTFLATLALSFTAVHTMGCIAEEGLEPEEMWDEEGEDVGEADLKLEHNGHDYLFVKTPVQRSQARAYCQSQPGYDLASVDDVGEQVFLNSTLNQQGGGIWYIGYNDIVIEGTWAWANGSKARYANWMPNEPNDYWGNEDCAVINYDGAGRWNDVPCDWAVNFICEKGDVPTSGPDSFFYGAASTNNAQVETPQYTVNLSVGQIFTVGTCGVPGSSAWGDTFLRVNNPWGWEIASNDDGGGNCGLASNLSFVAQQTGTYVIRAGCYGNQYCEGNVAMTY